MTGPMKPREVRSMNLDRCNTRAGDTGRGSVKGVRSRLEELVWRNRGLRRPFVD